MPKWLLAFCLVLAAGIAVGLVILLANPRGEPGERLARHADTAPAEPPRPARRTTEPRPQATAKEVAQNKPELLPLPQVVEVPPQIVEALDGAERLLNRPEGAYELEPLNDIDVVTLRGKVKTLKVRLADGAARLDATGLDVQEIIFTGKLDGDATVKLSAPNGTVRIAGKVDGGGKLDVQAPGGTVVFTEPTDQGRGKDGSKIDGGATVNVTAKSVEFRGDVRGGARVLVTLTEGGTLKLARLGGGAEVRYRKADPKNPEPKVEPGAITEGGRIFKIDDALPPGAMREGGAPDGNARIRARAGASDIVITTTGRVAGAIGSLTWDGKEFLDSFDHGRELQSAANFDCGQKFVPEVFNPTEAGSLADGRGDRSSSRLLKLKAQGNELATLTRMAFWLRPGEKSLGRPARNDRALSDHLLAKRVRIGHKGLPHAIEYDVTFTVPKGEKHTFAQFEAVTGYVPEEFSAFWKYDPAAGKLRKIDAGPGEQSGPVVLSNARGTHAMGVYSPDQPSPGYEAAGYGRWHFPAERVNKWNCVFRLRDPKGIAPGEHRFRNFVVVGSLADVEQTLAALHKEHGKEHGKP